MKGEVKGKGEYNIYLVNTIFLDTKFPSKSFGMIYSIMNESSSCFNYVNFKSNNE